MVPVLVLFSLMLLVGCEGEPVDRLGDADKTSNSQIDAEKIQASLAAAEEYLNGEDLEKAEAIIATLIRRDPQQCRAHELLGQIMLARTFEAQAHGDSDASVLYIGRAHEAYEAAVRCEPDSAGLRQSAGEIAQLAGDTDAALRHYVAAADLDPGNGRHPLYAAQIYLQEGNLSEAEAALDRVLHLNPAEPMGLASRALLRMEQARYEEAVELIREARQADPSNLDIRIHEARIHRRSGRPEVAVELLAGLGPQERALGAIAWELASSYSDLGQPDRAAAIWAEQFSRTSQPAAAWPHALRASRAYLEAGDLQSAGQWLTKARNLAPASAEMDALAARLREVSANSDAD